MTPESWSLFAIACGIFALCVGGLIYFAVRLIKGNRSDVLANVPLAPEQQVMLSTGGEVLVLVETPRTTSDHRGLQIQLIERQTGQVTMLGYSLITAQGATYGATTMQVPFGRMSNARAGAYVVRAGGIPGGADLAQFRIIFSKPYIGRLVLQIIGIVTCGVGMLLSVIWAGWLAGIVKPAQQ